MFGVVLVTQHVPVGTPEAVTCDTGNTGNAGKYLLRVIKGYYYT